MDEYNDIKQIMTCEPIPAGQLRLIKALWDTNNTGLSFSRLAQVTHGNGDEVCASLGSLDERVREVIDRPVSVPSHLVIERTGDGCYFLTEEVMQFIENTPSLKGALESSQQEMFDLHGDVAWQFVWQEDKQSGELHKFAR
jgi:hypothetical protein